MAMRETYPDFESLSAYVDGELAPERAAEIADLAARDRSVAQQLARLHALKASVSGLGGRTGPAPAPREVCGRLHGARVVAALAACLVMLAAGIALFAFAVFDGERRSPALVADAVALHDDWLKTGSGPLAPAAMPPGQRASLLAASGLIQVHHDAAARLGAFAASHSGFVGANGCRLSLFEVPVSEADAAAEPMVGDDALHVASWQTADTRFIAIARDMNKTRFAVVTEALRNSTEEPAATDGDVMASLEAARQPCLG